MRCAIGSRARARRVSGAEPSHDGATALKHEGAHSQERAWGRRARSFASGAKYRSANSRGEMSKTDLPGQTLRIQTSACGSGTCYGVARDVVAGSSKEPMSATTASRARSCPVVPRNARSTKRTIDECSIVT